MQNNISLLKSVLILVTGTTLSACQPQDSASINLLKESLESSKNDVASLKLEISALKKQSDEIKEQDVASLKFEISELQKQKEEIKKIANSKIGVGSDAIFNIHKRLWALEQYNSVSFDPTGQKNFQRLDTNNGTFLIILDNVTPYLDGLRVTLSIGNPSAATYSGLKLNVSWGKRFPVYEENKLDEYMKNSAIANASTKQKEISLTDSLQPGSWNKVTFNISPASAKEFGRLEVTLTTDQVVLRTNK